ncbi:lysophospholipid acyltransferase family protein [Pelomicrobium methylotrophicum]|uniref:Lysophospholipid acyltransferase family protein n=1 Tax=Pelomicrobium methylotrophicum TaxID=2602750 RepID=A0A5C7EGH8_9PROT|nr:lysophospholipid acyltransferase family protein [Pelomicrobium methylotrophicum]TXF10388.1 lysophospholipid acyltransferase family protein [Pelomicrobium methylotrophicum]
MLKFLLGWAAYLPLSWLHAIGGLIGRGVYVSSPRYARRLRENLAASGVCADARAFRRLLRRTVAEAGKGVAELARVWFGDPERTDRLVRECRGWEHVEAAVAARRGLILLTPHLGCFEIAGFYLSRRLPMTILYRPPRVRWLEPLMIAGRSRGRAKLATTDLRGVRRLLKALKRGEAIGVLPDQAPGQGEGVWADFFGRPAYTMTLVGRLAQGTGAPVLMVFARRLPRGAGYSLSLTPLPELPEDPVQAARRLNAAVEALVRQCPEQYLWSYNRYKVPAGVTPPPSGKGKDDG